MRFLRILMAAVLFVGWPVGGVAQAQPALSEVVGELQKGSNDPSALTLVWWAPQEYWRMTLGEDPSIAKAQAEEIIQFLSPYTIVFVVDGKMGKFGSVEYVTEANIRANSQIQDSQGKVYLPLGDDQIDQNARDFLLMMKPIFASMIGPMGQNMHAMVFPGRDGKGQSVAVAKQEGSFTVKLFEKEFKWKLPLGSLLPQKVCPEDGEKMSGAWKFCPWHGSALTEPKP